MTPVEDQIRTLLRDVAPSADPVHFDEIARRVTRRRTTTWSVAAAVTVLAVGGVAVFGAWAGTGDSAVPGPTSHRTAHVPVAVPWIDTPAPRTRKLPTPHHQPLATDAPPCSAGHVAARQNGRDGAGGHLGYYVELRNTGRAACLLEGYPIAVVASASGLPDVVGTDGTFFEGAATSNIAPGGSASLVVQADELCEVRPGGGPVGPPYHRLRIDLPHGGGSVPVRLSDGLDLTCGLHVSKFYVEQPSPPVTIDPLRVLKVSLDLPRTADRGTTLAYRVRLANPTGREVALDPCPGYLEALSGTASSLGTQYVKATYALNCAPVRTIAPRSSVWFTMQLDLPKDAPDGRYQVDWELVGGQLLGVHVVGTVMVASR
jgi:hypothetical protein